MQPLPVSEQSARQVQAEILRDKGIKPAAKPTDNVVQLRDFFPDAPAGEVPADLQAFRQEWESCETHGRYPANALRNGVVCWVPDCPTCAQNRKLKALSSKLVAVNVPKRFQHATFENYVCSNPAQQVAVDECRAYADDFQRNRDEGNCVVLYGNPGNGKNHLATALVRQVVEAGFSALIITARDYLEEVWGKDFSQKKALIAGFTGVDLLVIDEIEKTSSGKAAHDEFFALINARYLAELPTVVISNLPIKGIEAHMGEMAFDRLRQGDRRAILFNWGSYRNS
ncbi:ATP-binding protein [Thiothrix litoralis]|uniref:ATP-binding protein n=1 Tax=Thiothrix litoralis TaxID=2891210 RepID=A0ABX7WYV5_9GAMM|nr:ATP-binding protein [Thiothrix litoralis]QTR47483.1 ATP-binding protein [Thiothrix litoralis]